MRGPLARFIPSGRAARARAHFKVMRGARFGIDARHLVSTILYMSVTAKLFKNGSSQAVRLPKAFRLPGKEAIIHREGDRIILEPLTPSRWPRNFFKSIQIADRSFARPSQGDLPPVVDLGA